MAKAEREAAAQRRQTRATPCSDFSLAVEARSFQQAAREAEERELMAMYTEAAASSQKEKALEKEYDRGWDECMKYYWSKKHLRELDDKIKEERDPYGG